MDYSNLTKKTAINKLTWLLFYIFVFVFVLHNSFNYLDPDLGWHLKVGQEILANKNVPVTETYDYTLLGQPWVDHEWLSNTIVYLIFSSGGYLALNIFFALLIVLILFILNNFIKKYFAPRLENFIWFFVVLIPLEIIGTLAILPHIGVRVQELGILFLLLLLIIIQRFSASKNWRVLLWLLPLFYSWSCLHGSFLLGIFILGLWIFIKIIEKIISQRYNFSFLDFSNTVSWAALKNFALISLASALATLFTPYGAKLYLFLLGYTNNFYAQSISEWLPVYIYPIQYYQLIYFSLTAAALLIYYFNLNFAKRHSEKFIPQVDLWQLCLLFLFFALAFKSRRNFPLFFIVSLPITVKILATVLGDVKIKSDYIINFLTKAFAILSLGLATVTVILKTNFTNFPFANEKFCQSYPCAALQFIKSNPQYSDLKIFNSYNWGGYLIWTWPEKKIFIDGRLPQYPYNGHSILEDYYEFFDKNKVAAKIKENDIQLALLNIAQPPIIKPWEKFLFGLEDNSDKKDELIEYFSNSSSWQIIFQDSASKVYFKK